MPASSRPEFNTVGHHTHAKGSSQGRVPGSLAHTFSVTTALPLSLAVLLSLSAAAPGGAEDGSAEEAALGNVRVELAELRAEMEVLREEASSRIEHYESERERLSELTERGEAADRRAEEARERGEAARLAAARQAATVYKGGELGMVSAWAGPEGLSGMLERGAYLTLLGEHRKAHLDRAEAARVATGTLAGLAASAEREQAEAVEAADLAREEAVEAVTDQEEALEGLLEEQTRLEARLAEAGDGRPGDRRREEALRTARTANAPAGDEGGLPGTGSQHGADGEAAVPVADDAGPAGGCVGHEASGHANGMIPEAVLCPLPQAGERLRSDAAESFIELDGRYRERFGRPMCVADSYRPYHEQVSLFREKAPGMAARPGTSQHGLGVAVDLCGGVNQLGTVEHEWMLANAPGHGWRNPAWARNGFEPWHWEFTP